MLEKLDLIQSDIKKLIPHRDPFLFLTKITGIDQEEKSIVAEYHVSKDSDFFKGHFPEYPITPGVVLVESGAQAACVLIRLLNKDMDDFRPVFMSVNECKFRAAVLPDSKCIVEAKMISNSGTRAFKFAISISVNDKKALDAIIMAGKA